jgi:Glycosyltransferase sugar-binding region containing DXD motif
MWHLSKIPKIAHFYWGGGALSYLRFLSVVTFKKQNPNWQVQIHVPVVDSTAPSEWHNHISQDFRSQLVQLNVQVIAHDFDQCGFDNQAHEVHKSDFLRWKLLSTVGGVWSDIDILYVRPIDNLAENTEQNSSVDTVLCPLMPPSKHTVGFVMGCAANDFYKYLSKLSLQHYRPDVYQCMGSDLINPNFETFESFGQQFPQHEFLFLNKKGVYSITSKTIDQFYEPVTASTQKKFNHKQIIGYHWFGGHTKSQQFENILTAENAKDHDNFLAAAVKEQL